MTSKWREWDCRIWGGREFHSVGAEIWKAQAPTDGTEVTPSGLLPSHLRRPITILMRHTYRTMPQLQQVHSKFSTTYCTMYYCKNENCKTQTRFSWLMSSLKAVHLSISLESRRRSIRAYWALLSLTGVTWLEMTLSRDSTSV